MMATGLPALMPLTSHKIEDNATCKHLNQSSMLRQPCLSPGSIDVQSSESLGFVDEDKGCENLPLS